MIGGSIADQSTLHTVVSDIAWQHSALNRNIRKIFHEKFEILSKLFE